MMRAEWKSRSALGSCHSTFKIQQIRRDLPYYDAAILPDFVAGMSRFARDIGLIDTPLAYEQVVATQLSALWQPT